MTTVSNDRLEALVEKAIDPLDLHPKDDETLNALRSILAEAMEAGAWVTCPACATMLADGHEACPTCRGNNVIRRELAGAIWATMAEIFGDRSVIDQAIEKWGEKQGARP